MLSNSRGPGTLADTLARLGPGACAATSEEAAVAGDIVVVTVPVTAFPVLPATPQVGRTFIDTCNYGPEREGHISELDSGSLTSSELLLRYVPDTGLVTPAPASRRVVSMPSSTGIRTSITTMSGFQSPRRGRRRPGRPRTR